MLIHGGSLLSMDIISFGIKLFKILRIAFVRTEAFSSVLLSDNALSQSKPWMTLKIKPGFACL